MIVIQDNQIRQARFAEPNATATASSSGSTSPTWPARWTSSVYLTRPALGRELARQERQLGRVPLDEDTIVVPVPDTGKAAADAMAYELGVPSLEGLIRNRYVGRTFIEGQNRADRAKLKYTPLREVLEGKRVLLIEDTIVRSTTLKSPAARSARARRGQGGPRPRRLSADLRTMLLRHRHVHRARAIRPAVHEGQRPTVEEQEAMADELGADPCSICRSKPWLAASASIRTAFAGPA